MMFMDATDTLAQAYAPYAQARIRYAGWQCLEVIEITRRDNDGWAAVIEHEVDLTLADSPGADVVTVLLHSYLDNLTDEPVIEAARVIARQAADASEPTPCDDDVGREAAEIVETHPDVVARVKRDWCQELVVRADGGPC
jgi:hypothetical protein